MWDRMRAKESLNTPSLSVLTNFRVVVGFKPLVQCLQQHLPIFSTSNPISVDKDITMMTVSRKTDHNQEHTRSLAAHCTWHVHS
jgi:hypothetical protein